MLRLTEWELDKKYSEVYVYGYVAEKTHPKHGEWLCACKVHSAEPGDDGQAIIIRADGGEDCELPVKEMSPYKVQLCCEILEQKGIKPILLQGAAECFQDKLKQIEAGIETILAKKELYLIVRGTNIRRAYWRDSSGELMSQEIDWNFEEPAVVTAGGNVDFRFSHIQGEIDCFQWSDGLRVVWFRNVAKEAVVIRRYHQERMCPGESSVRCARLECVVFDKWDM